MRISSLQDGELDLINSTGPLISKQTSSLHPTSGMWNNSPSFTSYDNRFVDAVAVGQQYNRLLREGNTVLNMHDNTLYPIESLDRFHSCTGITERWAMTNPILKQLWIDDEIYRPEYEGDTTVGTDDYDYRRVYDKIHVVEENRDTVHDYIEPIRNKDWDILTLSEKASVLRTHQFIYDLFENDGGVDIDTTEEEFF